MLLQKAGFPSFLWLNNIRVCVSVSLSIYVECLGCFHILLIVSNTTNMRYTYLSESVFFISCGYTSRSGITGSHGNSIFNVLRNSILFSIVTVPIYIPTNSAQVFPFVYSFANACLLSF